MGEVELHLPPDVQYVGLARLVVCAAARQAGMSGERVEDLRIAVSEATANAVGIQGERHPDLPVVLQFGPTGKGTFEVTVIDHSGDLHHGMPAEQGVGSRDWNVEGALGTTIIRGLADDVRFLPTEGRRMSMRFEVGLDSVEADRSGETDPQLT